MEQSKYERTIGHCLKMTNRYEYEGHGFVVTIELGKLVIAHGNYRCNVIEAVMEDGGIGLYRREVHSDGETIGAIQECVENVKERISASTGMMSKMEEELIKIGFKRD